MSLELELQLEVEATGLPTREQFRTWAEAALAGRSGDAELVIRVVGAAESASLNQRFRAKSGPTNVLSFPFRAPPPVASDLLGDLVICAPVVAREAAEQGKTEAAHWAHLVVHGVLHLLGHDHLERAEAERMEAREREILAGLGLPDPYSAVGAVCNRDQGVW
jgi:probable rRNA maturation factor